MFTRTVVKSWRLVILITVLASLGCTKSETVVQNPQPGATSTAAPAPQVKQSPSKVGDIAKEIVKEVGSVQKTSASGEQGPLFVFEEFHTSRVGQVQIATMLLRLHDKYGLKKVGLEGAMYSGRPLNASWFRNMGGERAHQKREDLGVRLLAEGEISSAEFIALVFSDSEVYGIESASEYNVQAPKTNAEIEYLLAIAEMSLTEDDQQKVIALMEQDRKKEALEYMLSADPWVKKRYEALKSKAVIPVETELAQMREIQSKAGEVGAGISAEAKEEMDKMIRFLEVVSQRSVTMVNHSVKLPGLEAGVPSAMIIGAAHTQRVVELLTERNVAFAVIRPNDLNPKYGTMTIEQFERKSSGMWGRASEGTLGGVLNKVRKPQSIIERVTTHSYASMNMAGMLIAEAARGGGNVPDSIWPELSALPAIRFDRDSFTRDGYDVMYRAWLKQDDGREKEVWARVGTLSNELTEQTMEQKLLQASYDLKSGGGGGKGPPKDLPPNSKSAGEEGPRDGKRKGVVISRTGRKTLAVYGANLDAVKGVGRISG